MPCAGARRHVHENVLAAPLFGDDFLLGQLGAHALRIRVALVDLVHGDDDRHASRLRVLDRFDRLRHHAVIRRDHENDDVRRLRAACTHGREGRVTRRIEERDAALRACSRDTHRRAA